MSFMLNNPDKFGISFWMLVNAQTQFVPKILPYLGSHGKELRGHLLLVEDVVLWLMNGLFNKG